MRNWLGIILVSGVVVYFSRLLSAKSVSDKSLVQTINPRILKIDNSGLTVQTEIVVDNPSNRSLRLSKPVVTLSTQGEYLASSVPEAKTYEIQPLSRTSLETTQIRIPWSSLSKYTSSLVLRIPELIKRFRNQETISLSDLALPVEYQYSTYVNGAFIQSTPEALV